MALIRGVSVAGIGETGYFKRGTAPRGEVGLVAEAVLAACGDAGIDARDIDGVASYGEDPTDGPAIASALGFHELRWASLVWGGGGGGIAGALAQAAAAILSGQANTVAVYRGSAEVNSGRLTAAVAHRHMSAHYRAHGLISPAQVCALRTQRLHADGVPLETLRAVARAGYHHAAKNPRAAGRGIALDDATYGGSRWIAEPYRLYDCSRENDGAAALVVTSTEDADRLGRPPVRLVAVAQSMPAERGGYVENDDDYTTAGFRLVAERLWKATGLSPTDIDVVQVYENFTGAAVASMIDHGFCSPETAGEVLVFDNLIAPTGGLPINTAGGNVGEGFVYGIGLALEAVRQLRGESPNPVPGARLSMLISGPIAPFVSTAILSTDAL